MAFAVAFFVHTQRLGGEVCASAVSSALGVSSIRSPAARMAHSGWGWLVGAGFAMSIRAVENGLKGLNGRVGDVVHSIS